MLNHLEGLIDNRNRQLFMDLSDSHQIRVAFETCSDYSCYSKGDESIISVLISKINTASFTHELLHIYLRVNGVFIGASFSDSIRNKIGLKSYFDENLLEHIGNTLDHIKMLPLFIEMGFDKSEFIADYDTDKLTESRTIRLKLESKWFFKTRNFKMAVKLFLGKYFAVKACPNQGFNYGDKLSRLEILYPALYFACESFLDNWSGFEIPSSDLIAGSYYDFLNDFVLELEALLHSNGK